MTQTRPPAEIAASEDRLALLADLFATATRPDVRADRDASAAALRGFLEQAWCAETAYVPELWRAETPSTGQCAVTTALLVAMFGGHAVRAHGADGGDEVEHWWAHTPHHGPLDLTADQFRIPPAWDRITTASLRDLLAHPQTGRRVDLLSARLADAMRAAAPAALEA